MDTIYEQLLDSCDCLPDMEDDDIFHRNVDEMISLVSSLTCWKRGKKTICETFLNSERIEMIDIESFDKCSCDGGVVKFNPYYEPLNPETFQVEVIEVKGIEEYSSPVDPTDYNYLKTLEELRIDVSNYVTSNDCGCGSEWKLRITYDAGYDLIPECLLQLFCDILHVIYAKNECECGTCQACKSDGNDIEIEYAEGDEVSPMIGTYLNNLILGAYKEQLGMISLCYRQSGIWGVVV